MKELENSSNDGPPIKRAASGYNVFASKMLSSGNV